jgi:hypothetical protein
LVVNFCGIKKDKNYMKNVLLFTAVLIQVVLGLDVNPSLTPPGGIAVDKAPLFVTIGWDDNTSQEGMQFALSLYDGKNNADGTATSASFYFNSSTLKSDATLVSLINDLRSTNHEIGNHTDDHHDALGFSYGHVNGTNGDGWNKMTKYLRNEAGEAGWSEIIQRGSDTLTKYTDVVATNMVGFRAPFLEYGNGQFTALKAQGYRYDCSIEEYGSETGNWNWPYTLHAGSPTHDATWKANSGNTVEIDGSSVSYSFDVESVSEIWELPVYALVIPDDNSCLNYGIDVGLRTRVKNKIPWMYSETNIIGYDYDLWSAAELSAVEVLGMLKYNLDLRIAGNRAPFTFGAHSQYYAGNWAATNAPNATEGQMQKAMMDFVEYALSKSEVRVVSAETVIDWMENPTELVANTAPIITSTAPASSTENLLYTYTATVTDPDDANNGTDLTYSLSGAPEGMVVSSTGVVTWTPAVGVTTSGEVTLTVSDGGEDGVLPATQAFTIEVTTLNNDPTEIKLSNRTLESAKPAETVIGGLSTDDDEGDTHTYTIDSNDVQFKIVDDSLVTKIAISAGEHTVKIKSTDQDSAYLVESFIIGVTDATLPTYQLTIIKGIGTDKYNKDAVVIIEAEDPESGMEFSYWLAAETNRDGVNLDDERSATTTLTMPDTALTFTAIYEDANTYTLTVIDGLGGEDYVEGSEVEIKAEVPDGLSFTSWSGEGVEFLVSDSSGSIKDTIIMPAKSLSITATFVDLDIDFYLLTVGSGFGGGYKNVGDMVEVRAKNGPDGKEFSHWSGPVADSTDRVTIIEMPDAHTTVTANYKDFDPNSFLNKIMENGISGDDFAEISVQWNNSMANETANLGELAPYTGIRPDIIVIGDGRFDYEDLSSYAALCFYYLENSDLPEVGRVTRSVGSLDIKAVESGDRVKLEFSTTDVKDLLACSFRVVGDLSQKSIEDGVFYSQGAELFSFVDKKDGDITTYLTRLTNNELSVSGSGDIAEIEFVRNSKEEETVLVEYELINSNSKVIEKGVRSVRLNPVKGKTKIELLVAPNPSTSVIFGEAVQFGVQMVDGGFTLFLHSDNQLDGVYLVEITVFDAIGNVVVTKSGAVNGTSPAIFWNGCNSNGRAVGAGSYRAVVKYSGGGVRGVEAVTLGVRE